MHRKGTGLVLCPLLPRAKSRPSTAAAQRDAKAYWDSLTVEQEVWALKKMRLFQMGETPRVT